VVRQTISPVLLVLIDWAAFLREISPPRNLPILVGELTIYGTLEGGW
jgi:hypothetical protein